MKRVSCRRWSVPAWAGARLRLRLGGSHAAPLASIATSPTMSPLSLLPSLLSLSSPATLLSSIAPLGAVSYFFYYLLFFPLFSFLLLLFLSYFSSFLYYLSFLLLYLLLLLFPILSSPFFPTTDSTVRLRGGHSRRLYILRQHLVARSRARWTLYITEQPLLRAARMRCGAYIIGTVNSSLVLALDFNTSACYNSAVARPALGAYVLTSISAFGQRALPTRESFYSAFGRAHFSLTLSAPATRRFVGLSSRATSPSYFYLSLLLLSHLLLLLHCYSATVPTLCILTPSFPTTFLSYFAFCYSPRLLNIYFCILFATEATRSSRHARSQVRTFISFILFITSFHFLLLLFPYLLLLPSLLFSSLLFIFYLSYLVSFISSISLFIFFLSSFFTSPSRRSSITG